MYKIFDTPKEPNDVVNKLYVDNVIESLLEEIKQLHTKIDELTSSIKVSSIEIKGPTLISLENKY